MNTPLRVALTFMLAFLPAAGSLPVLAAELPAQGAGALLNTGPALQAGNTTSSILPADEAFPLSALVETDGSLTLLWQLAPHYYLYRKSLAVTQPDGTALALELPGATSITDEFFGEVAVYYEELRARVPAVELAATPGSTIELQLTYQGCVDELYCYPLQQKTLTLQLP